MRVEFINGDGGELIHVTDKEDVTSYLNFLKNINEVNIVLDQDIYYKGTVEEILYNIQYEDGSPVEILKVYLNI